MQPNRAEILEQNQKDRAYFESFSPQVRDALGAQATFALETWYEVCFVQLGHIHSYNAPNFTVAIAEESE